eukprot:scaffold7106_cov121-Cylindrotheca_fusiformis.AAC.3
MASSASEQSSTNYAFYSLHNDKSWPEAHEKICWSGEESHATTAQRTCNFAEGATSMLHPHPDPKDGQIMLSRLIDFDLSGSSQQVYPPGYKEHVKDNVMHRLGRPDQRLEKNHDCHDLGSAMAQYEIDIEHYSNIASFENAVKAWEALCKSVRGCQDGRGAANEIEGFIREHGGDRRDVSITVSPDLREDWEGMLARGTGSPNKLRQTPRGPARAVAPFSVSHHAGKQCI